MDWNRKLILDNGTEFPGRGFGGTGDAVCEVVFNTSMTGYQEILSDPSYTDQAVVMSYPLIGNYGITNEDFESRVIAPSAMIVRDLNESPSNFRSVLPLSQLLEEHGVPGICGVDTRKLVRYIRDHGACRALVTDAATPVRTGLDIIRETPERHDAVKRRSCAKKWYSRTSNPEFQVAAVDCGMKSNIVRMLNAHRCNVTVVPYDTCAEEILSLSPDGLLISNGPGDPADVPEVIQTLRRLRGKLPMFGICLGHQLIALSFGAQTYKMKFGHRGGNHPVKDVRTGKIEITSQNHSYAVDENSLPGTGLAISHINLLDGTVEGLFSRTENVFSVQYHPESAPGPQDSSYLFRQFAEMMNARKSVPEEDSAHTSDHEE